LLSDIDALAPMIARLAPDIERGRRLPQELVSALKSARVFSMVVPRRYGGLGLASPDALRAVTALSRLDGSVGWNVMIGHVASLLPFLVSEAFCERIFQDGEDHVIAASGQPAGTAERVPGGWRVTGSWPFASGCQNAEWIGGACVMMEGGSPIADPHAPGPMTRHCLLPSSEWQILDTWHVFGLKGTGSHHVALTGVFVPDVNFIQFPFGDSFARDRIFSRLPETVMLCHGAFAVGVAEGAISDLVEVAKAGIKQMFMATPLAETERFKEGLGRLDAELKAARALLEAEVVRVWDNADGKELPPRGGASADGGLGHLGVCSRRRGLRRTRGKQGGVRKLVVAAKAARPSGRLDARSGASAALRIGGRRGARACRIVADRGQRESGYS